MVADFIVGSPVRDDDFLFREEFVNDLWEALEKHNILLLAPRRIGKTSVMYRLLDYPRMNWMVIHLNVEALKSPSEFLIYLIDALNEQALVQFNWGMQPDDIISIIFLLLAKRYFEKLSNDTHNWLKLHPSPCNG